MNRKPILCIDDEPCNLALVREILQGSYRLVFARNGTEGIEAVNKHQPSLILLDVEMPGMNGFEVAQYLKSSPSSVDIPIIFVTSLNQEIDEQTGFDVGGVDYISKPISPPILRARVRTHLSLIQVSALEASHRSAIHMLGEAGHFNDTDTGVHIWRMAAYTRLIAEEVGWSEEDAKLLELAAPMHDTGKIGIPDAILQKPGKLTSDEWLIMKKHSQIGFNILNQSQAPVFRLAAEIALNHHERWDGSGYPNGLANERIPETARIVAIADVFDALTMRRPYKEPWPLERTLKTMEEMADSHLDAHLVEVFFNILPNILETKKIWDEREKKMKVAE
ncbi:HD domain-containing phosphohydrolase [Zooshikella harenae]|uniref:Response regulator n=1 Tax=Zooshikella harenae TaxID=2827238 RepID=A0ABS5ZBQ0_9GAMM|nr:HD domain-containing phosphohydrolase [Zooshikella harenae]MBU2711487.1 response regulator [Zooshikella harenae]